MENVLVSACLLGYNCRYKGDNCKDTGVCDLDEYYNLIAICPEQLGGLPTPRLPSEIVDGKVMNTMGEDNTSAYLKGAQATLEIAKKYNAKFAVLKSRSPSCGCGKVYDGTFSGSLVDGDGITAKLLKENGINVFTEEDF